MFIAPPSRNDGVRHQPGPPGSPGMQFPPRELVPDANAWTQFLLLLLILAITGNIIHDAKAGNPSIINYTMFVAVFGMLSLFYLIAGTINEAFAIAPVFMLVADALNTLFTLIGGIALAAYLKVHSCGNTVSRGSAQGDVCHTLTRYRVTFSRTRSRMDPTIPRSAAMNRKP